MRIDTFSETLIAELEGTRPPETSKELRATVEDILVNVRQRGDSAVEEYTRKFDRVESWKMGVDIQPVAEIEKHLTTDLRDAIRKAAESIRSFHEIQRPQLPVPVETQPGLTCWRKKVSIRRVGIYVPGGSAPLFSSLLMAAIPAQIAGCKEVVVVSPPTPKGTVAPVIYWTAHLLGLSEIYPIGGAQAVAALAYGTGSLRRVDMIVGPGNAYVNEAKKLVGQDRVSIDLPAGPSEVLVIADGGTSPGVVAADLLSQAEHDPGSQLFLVLLPGSSVDLIAEALRIQVHELPRAEIATRALESLRVIQVSNIREAIEVTNSIACEHVIVAIEEAEEVAEQITAAGSVFVGRMTPESFGDYASGTNHILPTGGWARSRSGLSVESFLRSVTYQRAAPEGFQHLAATVCTLARAEGLEAHARAITIRQQEES